ncbi:MAG TPA: TolC family protein, partial [Gemmataceae bacterium]|nr:TolC family protein [Gemmataceae bacterium]
SGVRAEEGATLSMPELINLGLARQPALAAARASLAAAESGLRGLQGLRFAGLFAKDLKIRKEQACLGVTIAAAGLEQAEWETRYAVVRNYYSVIYAREQSKVVNRIKGKLEESLAQARKLVKAGDPDIKVTNLDVDILALNLSLLKSKEVEAQTGIRKAFAALREALGVGPEYPLDIGADTLPPLVSDFNKETLAAMAFANRGEIAQAAAAHQVTALEVDAQGKLRGPNGRTFAPGTDVHAKPIPQGISNGEYRPGAIGLEMPAALAGRKSDRIERAQLLNERAGAVVDKTNNLVALEVEATYLKWLEAAQKVKGLEEAPRIAVEITDKVKKEFDKGKVGGEAILRAQGMEEQIAASYNEALYMHALALAALERVTAGGYRLTKQP